MSKNKIIKRCFGKNGDKLMNDYHDKEWGMPIHKDRLLFELIVLEGAQAGLSFRTILYKRENYRIAYDNFDVVKVSKYNEKKIKKLMQNSGIIRNILKIKSSVKNARVFIEIQKEFDSFDKYIWSFTKEKIIKRNTKKISIMPTKTKLSDNISKDLKKRGMSFVGSTIIYAYLQAVGIVNDHNKDCYKV